MLLAITANCQNSGIKVKKDKRLSLGVNFSPDYCYRTLRNASGDPDIDNFINHLNSAERPKYSFTSGIALSYNLKSIFVLEAGIQYSNKGFGLFKENIRFPSDIDPMNINNNNNNGPQTDLKLLYNFHYLDIPLRALAIIGNGKFRIVAGAGLSTGILLKANITQIMKTEGEKREKKKADQGYSFNRINISPLISVGIDYTVTDKLNLRCEPIVRYGAIQIIDAPVTSYLWNVGMSFSCYYKFR